MMEQNENIITIRNRNFDDANRAFDDFMRRTESYFNEHSISDPKYYKSLSAVELERETERVLKEIAPSTPFRPEEIKLVSGHSFPDILSETYYGVEVKSTKENKWTSTGSSIVESTRDRNVENIYMLFGKLGGNPPAFRCRPYQDCLSNIAVTHSPRYLIDMDLKEKNDVTIFDRMNVSYNDFCRNEGKIEIVRDYYIRKAREENREEMPWWVGGRTLETTDEDTLQSIRLLKNCSASEILNIKAQLFILFPKVILGEYAEAALWLCTHRFLLSLNLRDLFSAGGQWKVLNNRKLSVPYPAVLGKLVEVMPEVRRLLSASDKLEIREFNYALYQSQNRLNEWVRQVSEVFSHYHYKVDEEIVDFSSLGIDLKELLLNSEAYHLRHK